MCIRVGLSLLQLLHFDTLYNLEKDLWPLIMTIGGFLMAKYSVFNKLHNHITYRMNTIIFLIILFCMVLAGGFMRIYGYSGSITELIFSIIIISFTLEIFYRFRLLHVKKALVFLGIYSMILWYMHGIFFTGNRPAQVILYYSQIPVIIVITGFLITIPISFLLYRIIRYINRCIDTLCTLFSTKDKRHNT